MNEQEPKYLGITGADGDGWKVLIWDDPQGEVDKIQSRLQAGETFTSVTVDTNSRGDTYEVTLESPVASCELLPLEPTVIKGALTPQQGDRHIFTPERDR